MENKLNIEIKRALNFQKGIYMSYWLVIIAAVLIGENLTNTLADLQINDKAAYYLEIIAILLAAGSVPLSLKVFSIKIDKRDWSKSDSAYKIAEYNRWFLVRILMLGIVALFCLATHYIILSAGAGFCVLIVSFATFFCTPSKSKFQEFVNPSTEVIANEGTKA